MAIEHLKLHTIVISETPFLYVRGCIEERNGNFEESYLSFGTTTRNIILHPTRVGAINEFIAKLEVLRKELKTLHVASNVFITNKHKLWRKPFKTKGDSGNIVHYRRRLFLQTDEPLNIDNPDVGKDNYQLSRAIFTAQVSTTSTTPGTNFIQFVISDCNKSIEVVYQNRIKAPVTLLENILSYLDNYIAVLEEVA